MNKKTKLTLLASIALVTAACATMDQPKNPMTYFVTSVGSGNGANLGGLAGADAHCQKLAQSVDAGGSRVWRAYLSTNGAQTVNASTASAAARGRTRKAK